MEVHDSQGQIKLKSSMRHDISDTISELLMKWETELYLCIKNSIKHVLGKSYLNLISK